MDHFQVDGVDDVLLGFEVGIEGSTAHACLFAKLCDRNSIKLLIFKQKGQSILDALDREPFQILVMGQKSACFV